MKVVLTAAPVAFCV